MNIVLCGMMGVGKSSVGRRIAKIANRKWVDTDCLIRKRHGNIPHIFARYGEEYFRGLETEVVRELSGQDGLVISTGGGLVLKEENCELLKANGSIVFLNASLGTLLSRIRDDGSRPLLYGGDKAQRLRDLMGVRMPVYESVADHTVMTDKKSVDRIAREILALAEENK